MQLRLYYPVDTLNVSQKYGPDGTAPDLLPKYTAIGLKAHNGWDFVAPDGSIVRAAHHGTVTYAGLDGSNGYLIVIRTDEQYDYDGKSVYFKTLYGHLKTGTLRVTAGQKVRVGDLIALADNTGMSTGSHLHFGLKPVEQGEADWQWYNAAQENGYNGAIDPAPYWTGYFAKDVQTIIATLTTLILLLNSFLSSRKGN